ncbi:hypothetical protein GCM10009827_087280 [Dactylosporangium maewongense]|uniref:YcxB-like protein domain-containing protein n=1 Tax=Dactylosporangium maewongense TaxID=634393 RepID=A0ABN2C6G7_9ACTN
MLIEFTFARPQEYFRRHLVPGARRAAVPRVAVAVGLALLGYVVVTFGDDVDGVTAVWVSVLFTVAVGFALWRAWRKYVALMAVPTFWLAARHYVIDDEAVHATTELSAVTYHWPLVQRVWVVPEAYIFGVEHFGIFDLPRAVLTERQNAELRTFLAARGLLTADAMDPPTATPTRVDPEGSATV